MKFIKFIYELEWILLEKFLILFKIFYILGIIFFLLVLIIVFFGVWSVIWSIDLFFVLLIWESYYKSYINIREWYNGDEKGKKVFVIVINVLYIFFDKFSI